jgi:hypothetical protein
VAKYFSFIPGEQLANLSRPVAEEISIERIENGIILRSVNTNMFLLKLQEYIFK